MTVQAPHCPRPHPNCPAGSRDGWHPPRRLWLSLTEFRVLYPTPHLVLLEEHPYVWWMAAMRSAFRSGTRVTDRTPRSEDVVVVTGCRRRRRLLPSEPVGLGECPPQRRAPTRRQHRAESSLHGPDVDD